MGGGVLARVLSEIEYGGSTAAVGLAGGADLATTVIPFLLRGVNLLGIDSVMCPAPRREQAWQRLARTMPLDKLERLMCTVPLADVPALGERILRGQVRGRVVVDVRA